jgi:hypothetical protein
MHGIAQLITDLKGEISALSNRVDNLITRTRQDF